MKTKIVNSLAVVSLLMTLAGYGYYWFFLNGTAKKDLPSIGSVVYVEATLSDNTFVGVHAKKRLYYKNSDYDVNLKAGSAYEVVRQEGTAKILGPAKKTLKLIR